MYIRFGNLEAACFLFGAMPQRNVASWSTMISGYVKLGLFSSAVGLFRKMQENGVELNGFVLASLVTACVRSEIMMSDGIQVHGLVIKVGLCADVFVSSALLHLYGLLGFLTEARQFFNEMSERNIVSWTSLMVGYSRNGEPEASVRIYQEMKRQGVISNTNTLATVVSSCSLLEDVSLGLQVLAHIVMLGLDTNVSVTNSLIFMFGSFGNMEDAVSIFETMEERDLISWNSVISAYSRNGYCEESLKYFGLMRRVNVGIDSATLSSLISACSNVDNLKWGRGIHSLVIKVGIETLVCIGNTLITLYAMSSGPSNIEKVFYSMSERDVISWNSMIASYIQTGQNKKALELLSEMLCSEKERNHVTFASSLAACSYPEELFMGKMVHAVIISSGSHKNLLVGNALITMYSNCGAMDEATRVFQTMPETDLVTWNAMIGGHVENEEGEHAMKIFNQMREAGIRANYITLVNVLGACSAPKDLLKYGMSIHGFLVTSGFEVDNHVKNSLLTMYAKSGDLDSSNFIFNRLERKNVVTWNAIITANAHQGHGEEATKLFLRMQREGLELDQFSILGGLVASSSIGLLEEGQQLHCLIIKLGFEVDLLLSNALMDTYGKCGKMDDVLKIFPEIGKRSRLSWNILISMFARHGSFSKARETFQEMVKTGIKPDYVTFVSLLSACNHAGLVDAGLNYFYSMSSKFRILPRIEHCVCIVDLLGRSGRLLDAEKFITEMPVPPNDLVWRSLLAACKIHRNLDIGKRVAEELLLLHPGDDSAYVLLSNIYATNGKWDAVERIRSHMQLNEVKKKPACSWIKVWNEVSAFGVGDRAHPQANEIYAKLEELLQMIKAAGYVADTSFVLHDTDEEQKEQNLWNHSEKLALAYGLISTPKNSTIRVFKNLRVCGDCHSVYKFVSGSVGREILLRDPYRFHHFSGGKCSCSDYW
ncbi:pentatricopeptide repeat-containing protein At3g24000, mitochondrial [Aristolochia californica]|uniref:pentatricopeptide repeat-containing protein At3g24000, mitochondrial n=1 Tax=Aristolochia californica TaxID=171875 RepID=UPI0035D8D54B